MSEYTPTTDDVKLRYRFLEANPVESNAEFARWLDRVRAVARREGQAEAWDEGFEVGTEAGGRWAENGGPDNDDRNPYRNGEGQ